MRKFDVPQHFRSPIISKVKAKRKLDDPRKQNFSPSYLEVGNTELIIVITSYSIHYTKLYDAAVLFIIEAEPAFGFIIPKTAE